MSVVRRARLVCGWFLVAALASTGSAANRTLNQPAESIWRADIQTKGTPVAMDDAVYALTRSGGVAAIRLRDGAPLWSSRQSPTGSSTSGPVVTSGTTLALWRDLVIAGHYDLTAYDRLSGTERWRFTPRDGYAPGLYLGSVSQSGVLFAGSPSGHLFAVDAATGAAIWTARLSDSAPSTVFWPLVDGDTVLAGFTVFGAPQSGGIAAWDIDSGKERWKITVGDAAGSSSRWSGGPVPFRSDVLAGTLGGNIVALDRASGQRRWTIHSADAVSSPSDERRNYAALCRSGETLVAAFAHGTVRAFDLHSRTPLWQYRSPDTGSPSFRIVCDEHNTYVPFMSGQVVVLDLRRGTQLQRLGTYTSGFIWPPLLLENAVILAGSEGVVAYRR